MITCITVWHKRYSSLEAKSSSILQKHELRPYKEMFQFFSNDVHDMSNKLRVILLEYSS